MSLSFASIARRDGMGDATVALAGAMTAQFGLPAGPIKRLGELKEIAATG